MEKTMVYEQKTGLLSVVRVRNDKIYYKVGISSETCNNNTKRNDFMMLEYASGNAMDNSL